MARFASALAGAALAALAAAPTLAQDRTGVTDTTIKIGIPGPLTGPNASFGAAAYGIQAYYKWVNAQGGVHGRKFDIVMGDYACNEAKGVAVAKKLIHEDKVFLMNGGICSGVALAMRPIVEESGVPWVVSTAVNQKITEPVAKNIFHGSQTSRDAGNGMAAFALSKPGTKKIGLIGHTNEWSKGYLDPMTAEIKKAGITPAIEVTFERGQTDATAQILKLKEANLDFIGVALYEPELAIFLRDAHKYGLNVPKVGSMGADYGNTEKRIGAREPMLTFFQGYQFKGPMDGPSMTKARQMIEPNLPQGEKVVDFTFYGAGSAVAIVHVLNKVGRDLTREKFIAEMEKLKDFDTGIVAGTLSFSPQDHQGAHQLYTMGYDASGKIAVYEKWGVATK